MILCLSGELAKKVQKKVQTNKKICIQENHNFFHKKIGRSPISRRSSQSAPLIEFKFQIWEVVLEKSQKLPKKKRSKSQNFDFSRPINFAVNNFWCSRLRK